MSDLLTADKLVLFLVFVVPGFVAMKTHDLLIPTERRDWSSSLIDAIAYSMLNFAALFWLIGLLQRNGFQDDHPILYTLGLFVVLLLAPVGWAVGARTVRTSRLLRRFVLDPTPTSWDFWFSQRQPVWVLIHLKGGGRLGGLMASRSFASASTSVKDLYIEEIWRIDEDGRFLERIDRTAGALVSSEECSHIEFFTVEMSDEQT